ncbi:succinate dehydrogenase iron-sulfur subunit [Allorhodopirellula solitaria]|uniref:Fumarate reductase iron-sulfur subunit n=1 Tax=Allorhodopirellula solitaria TaxID=2527987 RepID=A0A5C5XXF5_9BACT|nr:succinate dehydrogenase iron-sulfur subunit [Allorhodopirellula solitaria]TWT66575.1 Fumarate reductase iron-sulfur subunit [Allorhodopirellula solitaria]
MTAPETSIKNRPQFINVRVLRQDEPGAKSYWELHKIKYEREMNVISVLQRIAAQATTVDGKKVTPVAWDCGCLEEVCGSCTMVINGRVRQSCSALVDRLLADNPDEIVLEPMTKFPVVRDLMVDRARLFRSLKRIQGWVPVDSYYNLGPGERIPREDQERNYPLSQCMSCGCCLDACPQYQKIELTQNEGESDEEFEQRQNAEFDEAFIGAAAISQAMLFNNHPTGKALAAERLEALSGPGGITTCGNAQNCVAVCPKEIPLTRSIARTGRATTLHAIKKWFER